ncbi:MAG: hypothetical protein IKU17_10395 [Clostridia bacterium]|nr:hypothetical protein [Clostridia bacterium]
MRRIVSVLLALFCVALLASSWAISATEVPSEPETSSTESVAEEMEFIDNKPAFTLPEEKGITFPAEGILGWSVIFAAILGIVLFVYTAHVRDRRAFRSRSAARSRWQRRGPVRSGMSEKIHHENSHMRR